ncbi:MAG: methyltransferase domain-containing protein [Gemmatimonadales bacterium]|nr:methyltransferase domain-containing protein [Gemmatimonadales bacterium]
MRRVRSADQDQFARIAPHYDALMANVPYGLWANYIGQLAHLAGRPVRPGSKLLDLATGTGSLALQFAERGCDVTGIDLSAPMIAEAKRKAADQGLNAVFLCRDLADFHLPPEFDYAICVYDSLNYVLDGRDTERAFANTRRALKSGALLVFDVNTVRALEAELFTQDSRPGAAVRYRWKSTYDPETRISKIRMDFRIPDTGERFAVTHHQRAYTDAELRSYLRHAGFRPVTAYEAYRFVPPSPESDRVFYVAVATHTSKH